MSLATKLSEVGRAIGYGVPRDGRNSAQGYDYTSAARVSITVGPELAARRVAVSTAIDVIHREAFQNVKGNRQHHIVLRVTMTFIDGDGGETLSVQAIGEGVDSGDKASAKAMTMAVKYCYVQAFTLAMGEDPEADEATDRENAPISAPLKSYAYGPDEAARAEGQAATAKQLADGFADDFQSITHVDNALAWIDANVAAIDSLGEACRKSVSSRCLAHVKTGVVEGMSDIGFKESWRAAVEAARGGKRR